MELEGSLKAFSLPEILQFLAMGKLTGTLMVRHDHEGIDLVIRHGRIVNSATFDHSRRLGQLLVHRRLLLRSVLDGLLHDQLTAYRDKMLGQMLIERELISQEDLQGAIRAQLEEEIWELFSWESGEFRFEHASEEDIRDVMVEIDVEPLIIEGTRRIDEWKAIIRNLRGDKTVLGVAEWNPQERNELTLTAAEWQVLSLVNGFFSIASIAARTGIGKFESYRILNAFLTAGICYVVEPTDGELPDDLDVEFDGDNGGAQPPPTEKKRSFFAKRKPNETSTMTFGREESFATPVGMVARFVNLVANSCFSHRDFNLAAGDERFLEREWKDVVMDYPMADLVQVVGNEVDIARIDSYLAFDEEGDATCRAYEDTLEGLRKLYGTMATVCSQRMGERTYQRVVNGLQKDWLPRCNIQNSRTFDFAEFLARSLPIAQGDV